MSFNARAFEFEMKVESPEHSGWVQTFDELLPGQPFTLAFCGLSIPTVVTKVKQRWIGMRRSDAAMLYEGTLVLTNERFNDYIDICGMYSLEKLCQEAGIPQPTSIPAHEPFFVNFRGSRWELVSRVADMMGIRWYLNAQKQVVYSTVESRQQFALPTGCTEVTFEEGWFGPHFYEGVQYTARRIQQEEFWYKIPLERSNCRITLEPPFKFENWFYAIVNIEVYRDFPFIEVTNVSFVTPPSPFWNRDRGITNKKDIYVREWDYELVTQQVDTVELIRGIRFRLRIATAYMKDNTDPVLATIDHLWKNVFEFAYDMNFSMKLNAKVEKAETRSLGQDPKLNIDVSIVPAGFADYYAQKMFFYNTKRKRTTFTKPYRTEENVPTLDNGFERIQYHYTSTDGLVFVTAEVVT